MLLFKLSLLRSQHHLNFIDTIALQVLICFKCGVFLMYIAVLEHSMDNEHPHSDLPRTPFSEAGLQCDSTLRCFPDSSGTCLAYIHVYL